MTVTLGQRIQSCEAFFLCRVVLTYATCTLHWQHLLTLSSAPHFLSSWCSLPPPRAVLESLRNFMCSLTAAALPASVSGSLWRLLKCLQWAGRVAEPGWPWQISDVVFAPFGAIFNDKGDRLCLPITGVGWEANGSFLAKRCHDEALCSGGLLMHSSASASLVPSLINSSEGFSCCLAFAFGAVQAGKAGGLALQG